MSHIFISYSHKDKEYVHKLQEALQTEGFDAWIDGRIDYGDEWLKVIQKNLDECDAFIIVMSKNSFSSDMVQNEVTRARDKKKPIFPLLLDGENWLVVQAKQFVDVRDKSLPTEKFYKRLESVTPRKKSVISPPPPKKPLISKNDITRFVSKLFPLIRYAGILLVIGAILWVGSLAIPFIATLNPTSTATIAFTLTSQSITPSQILETVQPSRTSTITTTPTKNFTPTATPLPTEIADAKGVSMMLVPAGEFTMGSDDYDSWESPAHMVYVDTLYIDKYEVTNALYKMCVEVGACIQPNDIVRYANPKYNNHPVVYVNWKMSSAYCEWRGARLPTEAEWEKAARGTSNSTYPWGEAIDCSYANYYGANGNCVGDTTEVGKYENGKSVYGVYDMAGNVYEWVSSLSKSYPYDIDDGREDQDSPLKRIVRGGSWNNIKESIRSTKRTEAIPLNFNYYYGFRCARDATAVPPFETSTPALTPLPTNTPNTSASGFEVISIDKIAYRGGTANAQIRTQPGTYCTLTFFLPSGAMSTSDGVGACTADQDGYCSWSWTIHGNVNPGTGTIVIIAGGQSESYAVKIE